MPLDADVEALIAKYEKLEDMLVKLYPEAVPGHEEISKRVESRN
jgi:hypothetical protein